MRKSLCLPILALLISASLFSQSKSITGKVVSKKNGVPISRCSVFISNTSKGTVTNESGDFKLDNVPMGNHELVVSNVGYETYVYAFNESQLPLNLDVHLQEKVAELAAVEIEPFAEDGWQRYGRQFFDNFIGTLKSASSCIIKNKEVIHFHYSSQKDLLTAVADEPLIIENEALGYTIQFQLEKYSFDKNNRVIYLGYPLFSEMTAKNATTVDRWKANREKAYNGSLMHFIRSLYNNNLQQEGFEGIWIGNLPNPEKQRVEKIMNSDRAKPGNNEKHFPDSTAYYLKVMRQPDSIPAKRDIQSEYDRLVFLKNNKTRQLFFTGNLVIDFKDEKGRKSNKSFISLISPQPVMIEPDGSYDPILEIFMSGYWALSETVGNSLPFDYTEPNP